MAETDAAAGTAKDFIKGKLPVIRGQGKTGTVIWADDARTPNCVATIQYKETVEKLGSGKGLLADNKLKTAGSKITVCQDYPPENPAIQHMLGNSSNTKTKKERRCAVQKEVIICEFQGVACSKWPATARAFLESAAASAL